MLKTRERTFKYVSYSELSDYIKEVFNLKSRFEIYPKSNDTIESYTVGTVATDWYERYTKPDALKILKKGNCESYELVNLLEYMFVNGHLEAGEYLVEFSW